VGEGRAAAFSSERIDIGLELGRGDSGLDASVDCRNSGLNCSFADVCQFRA
jgi:hypothetical protein